MEVYILLRHRTFSRSTYTLALYTTYLKQMNLILHDFLKMHNQLLIARVICASQKKKSSCLHSQHFSKIRFSLTSYTSTFQTAYPVRRYLFTGLHVITFKKTAIIVTAILNNKSQSFNLIEWNATECLSTQSILN